MTSLQATFEKKKSDFELIVAPLKIIFTKYLETLLIKKNEIHFI
jgi:hypothetical protein